MHPDRADPADAREILTDLIAAVDYLTTGPRLGLTIWEAIEEAIRWWTITLANTTHANTTHAVTVTGADLRLPLDDPDPLRTAIGYLLTELPAAGITDGWSINDALQHALASWTRQMADIYNDGRHWPPPVTTRSTPAPPLDVQQFG